MKFIFWMILVMAAGAIAGDADSLRVAPDFHSPATTPGLRYTFGDFALRDRPGSAAGYLAVTLNPGIVDWAAPPTRFDAVLTGAGAATSMGMFLGAVATTLGWFDEDTSWAITGAMAAAGAIYAGTRYEVKPRLTFNREDGSVIPGYAPR